jgi:isoleucyl-tRNA synthetase
MKGVAAAVAQLSQQQITELERSGALSIEVEGKPVTIDAADLDIISEDIPGWLVANEGSLTAALDIAITPELKSEGMARELINRIQNLRKDSGFEITDRIRVAVTPNAEVEQALQGYGEYVKTQVLANAIVVEDNDGAEVDFDDFKLNIKVEKQ